MKKIVKSNLESKVIENYCAWLGVDFKMTRNGIMVSKRGYYIYIYPSTSEYYDPFDEHKGKYIYVKELIRKKFNHLL